MALKVGGIFRWRSADPLGEEELVGLLEPGGYFDGQCHMPIPDLSSHATEPEDAKKRA